VARTVELFIIRLGVFAVAAAGDARFASLFAQGVAVLPAVVAFILDNGAVAQPSGKFRCDGVVADVAGGKLDFGGKAHEGITHGMNLCVEPAAGTAHGLRSPVRCAVGVLVHFGMGAVGINNLFLCAEDQQFMEPVEEAGPGEPVKILKDSEPVAKAVRQGAPGTAVEQPVPESVEVLVYLRNGAACMYKVVVSEAPLVILIF
jgi:hypothetical protein